MAARCDSSTSAGERLTSPSQGGVDVPLFADQLMEELEGLVNHHRSQIHECLERHVRVLQGQSCLRPAMQNSFAPCEPPAVEGPESVLHKQFGSDLRDDLPHSIVSTRLMMAAAAPRTQVDATVYKVATGKKHRKAKSKSKLVSDSWAGSRGSTVSRKTPLQRITSNRYYEWASGTLICLNAVFIGWQTQDIAVSAANNAMNNIPLDEATPPGFLALQIVFTLLFCVELGLRWVCDGILGFFQDGDRWWNVLDVTVVSFGIMDLLMHFAVQSNDALGNISILRVLRVVRIVRVAKVIRIMRFFRELRMMIFSILGSMKSLLWVILVLAMMFYVFGITFTVGTSTALDSSAKWRDPATADLREYFGTVDRSVLTLFMAMSGGNDWSVYYDALHVLPIQYSALFLLFISFAMFAVVNIVTGVFVESALESNSKDRDVIVHEELENKKTYLTAMREIFEEMDDDNTGSISLEEFEAKLSDDRVIAYFSAMKLDISDARTLFWLIDFDQSNEVNIDEFLTGCYKLQGESRSLDMKIMQCEVRYLRENFAVLSETLHSIERSVAALPKLPSITNRG